MIVACIGNVHALHVLAKVNWKYSIFISSGYKITCTAGFFYCVNCCFVGVVQLKKCFEQFAEVSRSSMM